jgi:hypothetical protein
MTCKMVRTSDLAKPCFIKYLSAYSHVRTTRTVPTACGPLIFLKPCLIRHLRAYFHCATRSKVRIQVRT